MSINLIPAGLKIESEQNKTLYKMAPEYEKTSLYDKSFFDKLEDNKFYSLFNCLEILGIDINKPEEVYTIDENFDTYYGWYHLVGWIESLDFLNQNISYTDSSINLQVFYSRNTRDVLSPFWKELEERYCILQLNFEVTFKL